LTAWLTALHGPEGASGRIEEGDRPSVEPLKENFMDSKVTADLTGRSHDGPTLILLDGDYGRLHWFREMTRMMEHQECDGPSWVPS
ncbi:hypothetical protein HAX54_010648, partial [Datura stramonium]|nr:hypothetical protein [Datura stramonium]